MNMREGILDSLVRDQRTAELIQKYLEVSDINFTEEGLINEIVSLFKEGKIYIEYPPKSKNQRTINFNEIEGYWFELTQEGQVEWERIEAKSL